MPSAAIERSQYDPATRTLSVWFKPLGRRYDYDGVPEAAYAAFRNASSKGRHFNQHIRDRFRFRRIAEVTDGGQGRDA